MLRKKRFGQISTSHLFLVRGEKILFSRRFNTGFRDGEYSVIAGHIEGNENAIQAMIREAKEEVGIRLVRKDLKLVHIMHRDENEKRIDFFWEVKRWYGTPKIKELNKCDDLGWFDLRRLPTKTIPYIRKAINSYRKGIIYSEYGWHSK